MTADVQKLQKFLKTQMPGPHAYVVLLGLTRYDWPAVLAQVEKGLPFSALERFIRNSGLSQEQVLDLLQLATRTFMRRKKEGRLSPAESDRLVRAARVLAKTIHLFNGDAEEAALWLSETQRAFGGVTPLEMAKTEIGAHEVERLIGQLEHGVFP